MALCKNTSMKLGEKKQKTDNAINNLLDSKPRETLRKKFASKILGLCKNNTITTLTALSCYILVSLKMKCDVMSSVQSKLSGNTGQKSNKTVILATLIGF